MTSFASARPGLLWLLFGILFSLTTVADADDSPVVTAIIEGEFYDVANSIRMSITGKGINIAHELPASEMLNRTGSAYGYKDNIYINARTFEFCSALISQKLARQSPENIVLCPFTISAYALTSDPDHVRLSYRKPVGMPGSEAIVNEVVELINSIIEDATW